MNLKKEQNRIVKKCKVLEQVKVLKGKLHVVKEKVIMKKNLDQTRRKKMHLQRYSKKKFKKAQAKLTSQFQCQLNKCTEKYETMGQKAERLQDQLDDLEEKFMKIEDAFNEMTNEVIQTKDGCLYRSEIRGLYYQLLAENVPPKKYKNNKNST